MKLLTKAIIKQTPAIGATSELPAEQVKVRAKFFTPWTGWTWYMTELEPETGLAFGYAHNSSDPQGAELGYFSLTELESLRGPFGLKIERDLHFGPKTLAEVMRKEAA